MQRPGATFQIRHCSAQGQTRRVVRAPVVETLVHAGLSCAVRSYVMGGIAGGRSGSPGMDYPGRETWDLPSR